MIAERPIEILLVEDNPGDARLTQEAFKGSRVRNHLRHVPDGGTALAYLRREEPYQRAPRPHLILLDLNLPRLDGRQVLASIKSDDNLRCIPVIVLTTSEAEDDVQQAYGLNANCYVTKPMQLDEFLRVVKLIEDFWLTIVKLPLE